MVHDRLPAIPIRPRIARAPHHISRRIVGSKARQELGQCVSLGWINDIIGIEPERIVAGGPRTPDPEDPRSDPEDPLDVGAVGFAQECFGNGGPMRKRKERLRRT